MDIETAADPDAHAKGYEDVRTAIVAGLGAMPDGQARNIPGNYLMGAFQVVVEAIYTNRAHGVGQADVMFGMATLLGDILAHSAAEAGETAPVAAEGGQGLVNGFTAVLRAWAPRDEAQRSVIDTRAVLDAVAFFAALQISSLRTIELRSRAIGRFAEAVGAYCVQLSPIPQARKL